MKTHSLSTTLRLSMLFVSAFFCLMVFLWLPISQAVFWQLKFGYFFCMLLMAGLVLSLIFAYRPSLDVCQRVWNTYRLKWLAIPLVLLTTVLQQVHQPHFFKVTNDEPLLLSISRAMHEDRMAGWRAEVQKVDGVTSVSHYVMDKRPLLYPWLLSQVHSLTGYRPANAFLLNGLLGVAFLLLLYLFVGRYLSEWLALGAIVLWAGNPLWAQNCTGGGFEVLNLFFLLCLLFSTCLWMEKPDEKRFAVIVLFAACLANVRYESILFALVPVGVLLFLMRGRCHWLPWAGTLAPFALLSLLLSQIYFHANPEAFYQSEGEPFLSLEYVSDNLQSAIYYLFNFSPQYSNDWFLSYAGVIATLVFFIEARRQVKIPSGQQFYYLIIFWTVATIIHFLLLMSLRWGGWTDPAVARFSLPLQLFFLLVLMAVVYALTQRKSILCKYAFYISLAIYLFSSLPMISRDSFTGRMHPAIDLQWSLHSVDKADKSRDGIVLTSGSSIPYTNKDHQVLRLRENTYDEALFLEWLQTGRFSRIILVEGLLLNPFSLQWKSDLPENLQRMAYEKGELFDSYSITASKHTNIWLIRIPVYESKSLTLPEEVREDPLDVLLYLHTPPPKSKE